MGFDINRAINPAGGTPRNRPQSDLRVSECKICQEGIYASEPRIWARRVLPSLVSGLVHCICALDTGAQTVGEPTTGGQRKIHFRK